MSKLSLFLPPFAADYSGACAVLFPFDCMVVILDAGCCMRNYAEYDEPRWTTQRKPAFSAQIRTLDTAMGDERGVINQVLEAARELSPACITLVGTPVPAIVGMDLSGMAADIRSACGIPCLGLAANGFDTYECGVSRALRALVEAFSLPTGSLPKDGRCGDASSRAQRPLCVNLLGMTPLDYPGNSDVERWRDALRANDIEIGFDGVSAFGIDEASGLSRADASLAVSWGGLEAARLLEERAGVPFVAGVPFDAGSAASLARQVRAAVLGDASLEDPSPPLSRGVEGSHGQGVSSEPKVLLVGDQVMMCSLRLALEREDPRFSIGEIVVGSFFSRDGSLSRAGDFFIAEDMRLDAWLRTHSDVLVVGDPLLERIPSVEKLVEVVHPAVSGQLFLDSSDRGGRQDEFCLGAVVSRIVSLY